MKISWQTTLMAPAPLLADPGCTTARGKCQRDDEDCVAIIFSPASDDTVDAGYSALPALEAARVCFA